jgi:hypothetical protein
MAEKKYEIWSNESMRPLQFLTGWEPGDKTSCSPQIQLSARGDARWA